MLLQDKMADDLNATDSAGLRLPCQVIYTYLGSQIWQYWLDSGVGI
jgi:hypothetical protein